MSTDRADLIVVGAGTVGGWASYFAKREGAGRVVVLEQGLAGQGASSRAAGIVRAQGGTPATVAPGRWSVGFYPGPGPDGSRRVVAVEPSAGPIETERVILTGGPSLRRVGRLAGVRIPAGAVRHTVCVLEPSAVFDVERMPMVFDIGGGLYWRLEEGGLLFGWSDPDEVPGEARSINLPAGRAARARVEARGP